MPIYRLGEIPGWVEVRKPPIPRDLDRSAPSVFALVDYQDRVSGTGIERYCHTIELINAESRIEDASLLLHELNDQQEILFHHLRITRGGRALDVLDPARVAVNVRQRGLESHVVDGISTVSYSIEDLRVGDAVDFAYTIATRIAEHPVFGHYYLSNRSLSWSLPVQLQFIRLVNDSAKPIRRYIGRYADRAFSSEEGIVEAGQVYELALHDLPSSQISRAAPDWFWPDFLVLASHRSWSDVSSEIAAKLQSTGIWDEELDLSEVGELDAVATDQAIIRLLRFVQNHVRYKSESSGIFSHTPKTPSRTLAARHGDCKDKATLLKAMLKQIGVAADLVLVNSELGKKIASLPPSPLWFDHMILRIRHQGREYFVDPTIKMQGGGSSALG